MCKYVALVVLVALVALMVVAAVVVQEYGWTGFLILLGALVVFGYVLRKATPRIFMYLLTRPLRRMGAALRGARLTVHSVTPCDPPPEDEYDPDYRDDAEAIEDRQDRDEEPDEEDEDEEDEDQPVGPLDWYLIEFTVTPPGDPSSEGRIVHRPSWSPAFISAVGPRPPLDRVNPFRGWPPPDQFTGDVQYTPAAVRTDDGWWDEEVNQAFGEQRLRMRVGVTRAVRAVTIVYAQFTDLGVVPLPIVDVTPGGDG